MWIVCFFWEGFEGCGLSIASGRVFGRFEREACAVFLRPNGVCRIGWLEFAGREMARPGGVVWKQTRGNDSEFRWERHCSRVGSEIRCVESYSDVV